MVDNINDAVIAYALFDGVVGGQNGHTENM
jgi:hypothetical protein